MITLTNVSKVYGKGDRSLAAVNDVSLKIKKGEKIAIIGKSGSGKSTLMHLMSGLDSPTSGKIIAQNKSLHALSSNEMNRFRSQEIGFIFQSFFIEPSKTCLQNVGLPLEIAERARKERTKRAKQALSQVGLSDKEQELAVNLSGGQKQRLAIARAIVNEPSIIFADEPTGNLDSTTGEKIIKLLFSLNKRLGVTLLIVTHDHEIAKKCDRHITLKDGRIINSEKQALKSNQANVRKGAF